MWSLEVPSIEVTYLHDLDGQTDAAVEEALGELAPPYYDELRHARAVRPVEQSRQTDEAPIGDRADTADSEIIARWDSLLGIEPTGYLWSRFHDDPHSNLSPAEQPTMVAMEYLYSHFFAKCQAVTQAYWDHIFYLRLTPQSLLTRNHALNAVRTDWVCNLYMTEAITRLRLLGATANELARLRQ